MENITIKHEESEDNGRFLAYYDGVEAGYIKYKWMDNGNFNANGTLVYEEFRDKKIGKLLYDTLLNFAREKGVKIYPTCPYVVKLMLRDTSVHDLLDDDFKKENGL